jgi:threonyl-tRNA synthetase
VSFRFGDRGQINGVPRAKAIEVIRQWIADRVNEAPGEDSLKVNGD